MLQYLSNKASAQCQLEPYSLYSEDPLGNPCLALDLTPYARL